MQQSQDIGNVRRELILKALSAQRTRIGCPPQQVKDARIQAQKEAIERLMAAA